MNGFFIDRVDAGQQLAEHLTHVRRGETAVLGMARGGVVVGWSVARELGLPLRALVVRKIGAPQNPELALGAVSETGRQWLDPHIIEATGASRSYLDEEIARQVAECTRRQSEYAEGQGVDAVRNRAAIVVDDGVATGASALVAVESARDLGAVNVALAVPVASSHAVALLRPHVDHLVVLSVPEPFQAVGYHYQHFDQVTDAEVLELLRRAAAGDTARG